MAKINVKQIRTINVKQITSIPIKSERSKSSVGVSKRVYLMDLVRRGEF